MYLEDELPTRSTGFFNHNALYEINLPQSGGEINKGRARRWRQRCDRRRDQCADPCTVAETVGRGASIEASQSAGRVDCSALSGLQGNDGVRGDLNLTHTGGWRDATGYDQQSASLRWDHAIGATALLKTVLTASNIDQDTAGSSTIRATIIGTIRTVNYTPISFRKVQALRLSSAHEQEDRARLVR